MIDEAEALPPFAAALVDLLGVAVHGARAQQPAMPVIGVIGAGSRDTTYVELLAAFRQGLNRPTEKRDELVGVSLGDASL
jgi:hypothetical protein